MTAYSRVWRNLPEPLHGNMDTDLLWEAEQALQSIVDLEENPDIRNAFVRRLESFRSELEKAANLVANTEYKIAFIGDIGVGKTTALCRVTGLETPSGMPDVSPPNPALEVGGGGTTVCEVQIANGADYGLVVEPRDEGALREEVIEFARILMPSSDAESSDETSSTPDDGTRIAREVSRAIRNMSGLQSELQRNAEGRIIGRYDPAQKLAEQLADADALADAIWEKMALHKRTGHELWHRDANGTPNGEPLAWMQENFRLLNNGRHPDFSLPSRIEVILPQRILGDESLSIRIVDTKGIDDTAEREDLMTLLNESHTIAVLCSPFYAAPVTSVQQILERSLEARYPDLETKAAILVLPRAGEALAVKDDSGDPVTSTADGYFHKGEQARLSLSTANLPKVPVEFFNTHEDNTEECSSFLMDLVNGLQNLHRDRLEEAVIDALALVENYENEQTRAVQRQAATHLATWIDANRHIKPMTGRLQDSLMREIDTVNASSLRASVRRSGEWHNLDYPQQLSHGARVTAASAAANQLDEFRAIIENLLRNPDLAEASSLLQQARRVVASGSESLLTASQRMGREVHSEYMKIDALLWSRCVGEWGQGPGYKGRVAGHNRNWFTADQHGIARTFEVLVANEWEQILSQVETILPDDDND